MVVYLLESKNKEGLGFFCNSPFFQNAAQENASSWNSNRNCINNETWQSPFCSGQFGAVWKIRVLIFSKLLIAVNCPFARKFWLLQVKEMNLSKRCNFSREIIHLHIHYFSLELRLRTSSSTHPRAILQTHSYFSKNHRHPLQKRESPDKNDNFKSVSVLLKFATSPQIFT